MEENIIINNQDILEFEYPDFKIVFDGFCYYAENEDEEIIIIEDEEMILNEDLKLFDGYILTIEEFNEIKNIVNESKEVTNEI